MNDIVKRLREMERVQSQWDSRPEQRRKEAADEIERLRALIIDVIDAEDDLDGHPSDYHENVSRAWNALCEAVGR